MNIPFTANVRGFLDTENARNRANAELVVAICRIAFGEDAAHGGQMQYTVGHHIAVQKAGELATENEIPSLDSLLFNPDVMGAVFSGDAQGVMSYMATLEPGQREVFVAMQLEERQRNNDVPKLV